MMGHAHVDAQKLHRAIDALTPDDLEQVWDFIGYLNSRSIRRSKYHETEDERRAAISKAMDKLVELNVASRFGDPVEWQREVRRDRPLPGRE